LTHTLSVDYTASPAVVGQARAEGDTLVESMIPVGFVNYPPEWWHYSLGERYWAAVTGAAPACYGPLDWPAL
jgi:zinc D-Ala-D-Ala dipeptidase